MQGHKCRSYELWRKAKKEEEKEQQYINGTENILLKGVQQQVLEITARSRLVGLTAKMHGIPYVMENFWYVTYPLGSFEHFLRLKEPASRTPNSLC
ncbi:hypothetical protein TNCV_1437841 [Trichonephila clavipes]|nr:hypothetical protein TNCV_1437841 [Trichonephila clavipes]